MGYTTDFEGKFEFDKVLDIETKNILDKIAEDRHDEHGTDMKGPGVWCQWIPTEDGKGLEWDGNEKFYDYINWLKYLIKEVIKPRGFVLNGEVTWSGEENGDFGKIVVKDNKVEVLEGKVTYKQGEGK